MYKLLTSIQGEIITTVYNAMQWMDKYNRESLLGHTRACSLTELQMFSIITVFHLLLPFTILDMLLHRTPVPHIIKLYSPQITAWKSLRVHQAERPTFKTGFSEAAASHPKEAHALFMFIYTTSHILIMGSSPFHYCSPCSKGTHY